MKSVAHSGLATQHDAVSRALRVLLIAHGLRPENVGGVEQHVEGLARALHAQGHEVEVYCKTGRQGLAQGTLVADPAGRFPFPVTRVVYRHEGLSDLRSLYAVPELDAALAGFLATRHFDIAHVHHLTGVSTGTLAVLRARGIRSVLTLHDYWLLCPRGQMWHRRGEVCERVEPERCCECLAPTFGAWLPGSVTVETVRTLHGEALATLRSADALVVPSARALPPFAAAGLDTARVHVVTNGVATLALQRLAPPRRRPGAPLRIGYLGTLIPSKGLDVLVAAFQRLPKGSAELHVHGNAVPYHGDEGFLTRVFARLGPEDAVTYHGPYDTDRLPDLLAGIDVLAAPALWHEAFGLTVREALAAGRPVVVSRIGGLQDGIADGVEGFLVPPGDSAALAGALGRLAADPALLHRMSGAARRAARGFTAMAEELVAVYRATTGA